MSRGIGELTALQEALPDWVAVVLALVTQLGDVWLLTTVVVFAYWQARDGREDAAIILGLTVAGLAVLYGLKHAFALPRPEQPLVRIEHLPGLVRPLYAATGTAGGYGYPSGHAFMTTVVYVRLADLLTYGTRRLRFASAGAVVAAVCFSRVALGVHYLVDVLAGVAFALLLLLAARSAFDRRPNDRATVVFGFATVASGAVLLAFPVTADTVYLLAAALGAFGGWQLVVLGRGLFEVPRPTAAIRPLVYRGTAAVLAIAPLAVAVDEFALLALPARGGWFGLGVAAFVTAPVLRHSRRARRAWTALVFWVTMAGVGVRIALSPSTWRAAAAACRRRIDRLRLRFGA